MNTAMPDPLESPTSQTLATNNSFFTPLVISIMGISATALAVLFYHLLLVRYCIRRHAARMAALRTFDGEETPTGVDEKTLSTIPIITYKSASKSDSDHGDQCECAVCLADVETGDMVRLLPDCKHLFHVKCIDEWFVGHTSCPVCRVPVAPPDDEIRGCPVCRVDDCGSIGWDGGSVEVDDGSGGGGFRSGPGMMLRHCNSLVLPGEIGRLTGMELKRSLSMGQSGCVIIDMNIDNVDRDYAYCYSFRDQSIRQFHRVSMKVKESISRMCVGQEQGSGILPY
ncbi:hypothetical protein L1987_00204 [Smallanthus sonchifolius]|uniref:Uncharacterized protein n=1 Tax=Smallanthus sonchifolius TaxID=185202 RepID=A0ACB9K1V8_9ASTR|nr:hypothetical protein L1987_00204 [Smallanthus sonchifolius]